MLYSGDTLVEKVAEARERKRRTMIRAFQNDAASEGGRILSEKYSGLTAVAVNQSRTTLQQVIRATGQAAACEEF